MAKKKKTTGASFTNTSDAETNSFVKGMSKDLNASFQAKDSWFHARNAFNNSVDGDAGTLGNEPANLECGQAPYTVIGTIHKQGDEWVIYSTDDTNSEIGIFDDSKCEYKTLVNDKCLNFNKKYLITGATKENYDCTWQVYWDDNLNPSRTLNLDNIPYKRIEKKIPGDSCVFYEDTDELDCERIRLAPLVDIPCIKLSKAPDGGQLRNGSYQAYIAYVENSQVVTDYIGISNIQSLFDHDELSGSLELTISNLDDKYEDFELVILSNNNQQTVAKRIGLYSTNTLSIRIDFIDPALASIPLTVLFQRSPAYEKSESMYVVNDYLIRQGPTEQFDFNYQPLANQIQTEWVVAEYPASYYYKGGNKTSFMRDEQYAFFIRWIYNTGERSFSYHIPGRKARNYQTPSGATYLESEIIQNDNAISPDGDYLYNIYNTASVTPPNTSIDTGDGGTIIARGDMGYWQSTERYPNKPEIWNASYVNDDGVNIGGTILTDYDLCSKFIRHHKMPYEGTSDALQLTDDTKEKIRILGVQFSNIKRPVFNDGTPIPNIIGYEILRSSREGAKSILAKGIFRNMREYKIPINIDGFQDTIGLYPNYPYNDLSPDFYFHTGEGITGKRTEGLVEFQDWVSGITAPPLSKYRRDVFTFHSPELMFRRPFLNPYEAKFYGKLKGVSRGYFQKSENHPQQKLLLNGPLLIAALIGFGYAIARLTSQKTNSYKPLENQNIGFAGLAGLAPVTVAAGGAAVGGFSLARAIINGLDLDFIDALTGDALSDVLNIVQASTHFGGMIPGTAGGGVGVDVLDTDWSSIPKVMKIIFSVPGLLAYLSEGANEIIEMFYNLTSYKDFAIKYNSRGFYSELEKLNSDTIFRSGVKDSNYLGSSFTNFGEQGEYRINNLFRPDTVAIEIHNEIDEPFVEEDTSNFTFGQKGVRLGYSKGDFFKTGLGFTFEENICSLYGALKFNFENQYGQLDGIKQVQMRGCIEYIDQGSPKGSLFSTKPIFSGDVYINRYTEKTIMPIFTDFNNGEPDGYVFDYLKYQNVPYPRYHMNSERYDFTSIYNIVFGLQNVITPPDPENFNTGINPGNTLADLDGIEQDAEDFQNSQAANNANGTSLFDSSFDYTTILPTDLYCLDVPITLKSAILGFNPITAFQGLYSVALGYMYTHVNGVQDFFVESEINLAQRDWDEIPEKRFYDIYKYNNLQDLFHADIIKKDNFYKYDISLSASRFVTNLTNYGTIQDRDYDPAVAETCFTFYPKRLIYSLRAQEESKKDFWKVFLPNNYKDFKDKVSVIKPINQTGALMFFPFRSPKAFTGVDELQTDLGTKIVLGDGGLFAREPQNIVNSDLSNEYGSCESARSVINTPSGVYFISQAQGKIFNYSGRLEAISNNGMKWWFNKYLPSLLLKEFPAIVETELADNPVVGVGCQSVYDVNNDIVYFMKKDFSVKEEYKKNITFDVEKLQFYYEDSIDPKSDQGFKTPIDFGDLRYFNNASWTVSYDPKIKAWISFHDWHPELSLPSINHFLTTKTQSTDIPYCPPGYYYNEQTNECEKLIQESAPAVVTIDEKEAVIVGDTCQCEGVGYQLVYPDPDNGYIYNQPDGDCITEDINVTVYPGSEVPNDACNCYSTIIEPGDVVPISITRLEYLTCDGVITEVLRDSFGNFPDDLGCIRYETLTSDDPNLDPKNYYKALTLKPCNTYKCCSCRSVTVKNLSGVDSSFTYKDCDGNEKGANFFDVGGDITLGCVRNKSVTLNTGGPIDITYGDVCSTYDCGPTRVIDITEYKALCRKVSCDCPSPAPNTTITQTGECDDVYQVTTPGYFNPNPLQCNYFRNETTTASFVRGGLWRHNDRCNLYSNFYGVDYPWEVEFIENTGQMVNTVRSVEYQLESYVYKGDLRNGCGDDRWHDLDFNFDEAIVYNSEQVSGLLKLELSPKNDPLNVLTYPIIGPLDIRILYSKEEQKYRFNQFWDITRDRGEFTNVEQNIFITELNGYIKELNQVNLNYAKDALQHKKFRHYYNKVLLRRTVSNDRKMLLKLNNTKLNLSFR